MNIQSIFYKDKKGGFNKRLSMLYEYLSAEGHSLHFIGTERLPVSNKSFGQHLLRAPFSQKENLLFWLYFMVASFFKSASIAKKYKIDRIITFSPFYTFLSILPIYFLAIPAITFVRADNLKHGRKRIRNHFFNVVDWAGIKISDKIIFVSSTLKDVYQKRYRIPETKATVLPNNITKTYLIDPYTKNKLRASLGIDSNVFLISTSGVVSEGKNFSFLIESMKQLHVFGIKLIIIGDEAKNAGEMERLRKITEKLALREHVIFAGWQKDPAHFIAGSDLFVLPSKYEGSPNSLLEALGCGIPCLGSKIGEIMEILKYDELLFLLDQKEVLIEKIKRARLKPDFYEELRLLSKRRCLHYLFDWEKEASSLVL
jgi:glycosyltransferase involved in cell wall biosynthesis